MSATTTKNKSNGTVTRRNQPTALRRYGWTPLAGEGEFMKLDKYLLHVDHEYQRDEINMRRVTEIARNWSWLACGVIMVARRPDNTYWVYDGQHRLLAARKLESVQDLPCLVFEVEEQRQEARAFVETNNVRGPMKAMAKFKARLTAEDANALRVAAALEDVGYRVAAGGKNTLACIEALERAFERDPDSAATTLELCCREIYNGEPVKGDVFKGLFFLDTFLKKRANASIARGDIRQKLTSVSPVVLLECTRQAAGFHGKTGEKVYADGIVKFINKRKHANRLPSPLAS